jgi:hypothetical protein
MNDRFALSDECGGNYPSSLSFIGGDIMSCRGDMDLDVESYEDEFEEQQAMREFQMLYNE